MTTQVATLLQKEMSRKEFLATMGLAAGSVLGLSSIIKLTTGKSLTSSLGGGLAPHHRSNGYGMSPYGK
ncbi:MAG TPA: hypothetical protein VFL85_02575 [Candidatus Saccharimonadales bacterium]|nr:hypothetical protein [Candidatus Saccharimonadales bacterium]